jgi:hypothetical protein
MQQIPCKEPETVRRALQEVIDQRQFAHLNPRESGSDSMEKIYGYIKSLFEAPWLKKTLVFLERLFSPLLGLLKKCIASFLSSDAIWQVLLLVCVLLVIAMIIMILRTLKKNIVAHASGAERMVPAESGEDSETREEKASISEGNRDYLDAVKNLYQALLLFLDEKKLVTFELSSTNGEILMELRRKCSDEAQNLFWRCAQHFERILYAEEPLTDNDLKVFKENYYEFKRVVL